MNRSKAQSKNPSFSSTLLDEICNSFDSKNPKAQHFYFSDNTGQKQSTRTRSVPDRKFHRDRFFGSLSSSSDSNSSIFSSSDTELKKASSRPLCFGPSRIKPRKTEDKALFRENRTCPAFDDYDYNSDTSKVIGHEDILENQRTRSLRSSGNFKKPKAAVSPGGRIVSFLNSLFSNSRKTMAAKTSSRKTSYNDDGFVRKPRDYPSMCCSATSFSRSCLNKSSEKSSDGGKRSVRFSPVNFIASDNSSSRPVYANEEAIYGSNRNGTRFMSSSLPDEWNIRKSQKKSSVDGGRRSVEDIARDFLRDYRKNQTKSTIKNTDNDAFGCYEDEDDDDDVASDSSSDLFELDLMVNHHDRYRDELPVYETTCAGLIL